MTTLLSQTKTPEDFCQLPGVDEVVRKNMKSFSIVKCHNCGCKYDLLFVNFDGIGNPICPVCGGE